MKRFIGLLFIALGVLFSPVSFASDGPPTTKEAIIFSDIDHFVHTAEAVSFEFINYEKSGTIVHDVGKSFIKDYDLNDLGLASNFNWTAYEPASYPLYNEWLRYKHELSFKAYSQPVIDTENHYTRCNC